MLIMGSSVAASLSGLLAQIDGKEIVEYHTMSMVMPPFKGDTGWVRSDRKAFRG